MAQYENKGDRRNILLADELPEDMTGTQDTQHICGRCAWYSFAKLESICRRTGKEVAYFANKECFTTNKDMDMEENNNAQSVAESTGTTSTTCPATAADARSTSTAAPARQASAKWQRMVSATCAG